MRGLTLCHSFTPVHTGPHRFTPDHDGSHRVTPVHTGSHRVTPVHTGSHRVTPVHIGPPGPTDPGSGCADDIFMELCGWAMEISISCSSLIPGHRFANRTMQSGSHLLIPGCIQGLDIQRAIVLNISRVSMHSHLGQFGPRTKDCLTTLAEHW